MPTHTMKECLETSIACSSHAMHYSDSALRWSSKLSNPSTIFSNAVQCNKRQCWIMLISIMQYFVEQFRKFHAMHHHNTTMYCSESDSIYHHDNYYAVLCNVLCSTMPIKTKQFHVEQCNPTSSGIMRYVILRETCSER